MYTLLSLSSKSSVVSISFHDHGNWFLVILKNLNPFFAQISKKVIFLKTLSKSTTLSYSISPHP